MFVKRLKNSRIKLVLLSRQAAREEKAMAGGGCLKGWMRGKACQPLLRELKLKYCKLQLFSTGWFVIPPSRRTPRPAKWQGEAGGSG